MEFNLAQYLQRGIGPYIQSLNLRTAEEVRAVAQQIQDAFDVKKSDQDPLRPYVQGSVAPKGWAAQALALIAENPGNVSEAIAWLSGDKDPAKRDRVISKFKKNTKKLKDKLQWEAENIANILDLPANATAEKRQRAEARAEEIRSRYATLFAVGDVLGFTPDLVRGPAGDFISRTASQSFGQSGIRQKQNEPLTIITNPDGTFAIVGTISGKVFQDGFATVQEATARQTELASGARPDAPGAFDTSVNVRGDAGNVYDAIEEGLTRAEADFKAQNPDQIVTPEMRAEWLALAWDEINANGYYKEQIQEEERALGRSFDRLIEDVRVRETALAEEYRKGVRDLQTDLQDRGMLYGGVRQREETELATEANVAAEALQTQMTRGLEDRSTLAEQTLGTERSQKVADQLGTTRGIGRFAPGQPGFQQPGQDMRVFSIEGDRMGSIPREMEGEALARQNELENAFVNRFTSVT